MVDDFPDVELICFAIRVPFVVVWVASLGRLLENHYVRAVTVNVLKNTTGGTAGLK